jgi:hypothetical protein
MSVSRKLVIFGPEDRSHSQEIFINEVVKHVIIKFPLDNIITERQYIPAQDFRLSFPAGCKEVEWQDHHWLAFDFRTVEPGKWSYTRKLSSLDIALVLLESPVDAICILDELPQALAVLPYMIFVLPSSVGEGARARIREAFISLPEYFRARVALIIEGESTTSLVGEDKRLLQFATFTDSIARGSAELILRFLCNLPAM